MAGNYYTPFSVRIPDELLEKVKKLAAMNKRSANKQVELDRKSTRLNSSHR